MTIYTRTGKRWQRRLKKIGWNAMDRFIKGNPELIRAIASTEKPQQDLLVEELSRRVTDEVFRQNGI